MTQVEARNPTRIPLWLIIIALALGFGLLEAAQGRFLYREIPAARFWPEAMWRSLPSWGLLALLTPGVMWIARRVRLDGPRLPLALAIHLAAAAVFVLLYSCGCALVATWRIPGGPPFGYFLARLISNYAVMDVFIYVAVVSLVYVAQHQSERRERDLRESRLQTDLVEARLTALRAQLQPHFLFNALNAITGLAMNREHEKLIRSVSALSDLLRRVLEGAEVPSTSLAREMEFIDRYLEIMAIRFGERLRIVTDIAPNASRAAVPSLILQPLVENAVMHGVGRTTGLVHLRVGARRDGDALVLEVENREDRAGSTEAVASTQVASTRVTELPSTRSGLGLSSTRDRLTQLFGVDASFVLQDLADGGTRATIRLPWSEA